MKYLRFFYHWRFTTWALLAWMLMQFISAKGFSYDDGIEGIIVLTMGLWAVMFTLPWEFLYQTNLARSDIEALATVIGFLITILLDLFFLMLRARKVK